MQSFSWNFYNRWIVLSILENFFCRVRLPLLIVCLFAVSDCVLLLVCFLNHCSKDAYHLLETSVSHSSLFFMVVVVYFGVILALQKQNVRLPEILQCTIVALYMQKDFHYSPVVFQPGCMQTQSLNQIL